MDYKASRCGVADASLHQAKWGHIVALLGVGRDASRAIGAKKRSYIFGSSMCI